jgi:hypothetical protein
MNMTQALKKDQAVKRIQFVLKRHEESYNQWLKKNFPKQADEVIKARQHSKEQKLEKA